MNNSKIGCWGTGIAFLLVVVALLWLWTVHQCSMQIGYHPPGCHDGSSEPALLMLAAAVLVVPVTRGLALITPDARQARRRNAAEYRRAKEDRARFVTEYLGQGYGQEAADALAAKRVLDENLQQRVWTAADITQERLVGMRQAEKARQDAERQRTEDRIQRRAAVGELARCPDCERYVPASQGVILSHRLGSGESCPGEGAIVPRP